MAEREPRLFTREQKEQHASLVGHQCEFYIDKGVRCPETGYLEADHIQPYSKGGETEEDNLELLCIGLQHGINHHAMKHHLDEEYGAEHLIKSRQEKKSQE